MTAWCIPRMEHKAVPSRWIIVLWICNRYNWEIMLCSEGMQNATFHQKAYIHCCLIWALPVTCSSVPVIQLNRFVMTYLAHEEPWLHWTWWKSTARTLTCQELCVVKLFGRIRTAKKDSEWFCYINLALICIFNSVCPG